MSVSIGQMKYKAEIIKHEVTTNEYGEIVEANQQTKTFYCDIVRQDELIDKGAGRFEYSTHHLTAITQDFILNSGDVIQVNQDKYRVITVRYVPYNNIFYVLGAKLEMIK